MKYFDVREIGVSHDVIMKVNGHVSCDVVFTVNTDMSRLKRRGYVLRNASLGDFVVVRTSQSVLTLT